MVLAGDRSPLPGVRVRVLDSNLETASNERGQFLLSEVPVGTHSVEFIAGDFVVVIKTDILVKVKQTANLYAEIQCNLLQEQVTVTAGNSLTTLRYFSHRIRLKKEGELEKFKIFLKKMNKKG